jgi:nucleotide-binding universal stress UspA family protein
MTIRTILVAASGGSASEGAIELACRLASRLRAHVEGFHVVNDARAALAMAGGDMGIPPPELFEQFSAEAVAHAARTKASFEAIAERHHLPLRSTASSASEEPSPSAYWREATGYAPSLVAQRGRFFDLVILGRSERVVDEPYTRTIEETLEMAGRPILLAPADCPDAIGSVIAVAWNGSPEAVRAVAASLPLLTQAETVCLITIGEADAANGVAALMEHLAWHGIRATPSVLPQPAGMTAGEALLGAAAAISADLLVMGGYGRRPWREALFGGATREVLARKTMPLLLVH